MNKSSILSVKVLTLEGVVHMITQGNKVEPTCMFHHGKNKEIISCAQIGNCCRPPAFVNVDTVNQIKGTTTRKRGTENAIVIHISTVPTAENSKSFMWSSVGKTMKHVLANVKRGRVFYYS